MSRAVILSVKDHSIRRKYLLEKGTLIGVTYRRVHWAAHDGGDSVDASCKANCTLYHGEY